MNCWDEILNYGISYEKRQSGEKGSILSYNTPFLLTFGWIFPKDGSILYLSEILILWTVIVGFTCALAFSSCALPKAIDNCINLPIPSTTTLTLLTLCSFVMSFFVNILITRWWASRTALQSIMGASQDLLVCALGGLEASIDEHIPLTEKLAIIEKTDEFGKRITAYSLLVLKCLLNNARDRVSSKELIEIELLTVEDVKLLGSLNNGNPTPLQICCLLAKTIQQATKQGILGKSPNIVQANLSLAMDCMRTMRGQAATVSMYADVQLPYSLIQVITIVVYGFTMQLIIVCASFVADGYVEKNGNMITGFFTVLMYSLVVFGLLKLFQVLENPLGTDFSDFPSDTYYNNLKKNMIATRMDMIVLEKGGSLKNSANDADIILTLNPIHNVNNYI